MALSLKELIITYQANAAPVIDALNRIDAKLKTTSQQLNATGAAFTRMGTELGLMLSLPLALFGKASVNALADMQSLEAGFSSVMEKFKTGLPIEEATSQELKFLKQTASELGVSFQTIAKPYLQYLASSRDTLEVSRHTIKAFLGVGSALGMSRPQVELMIKALQQMQSKGQVMAEELKGQLGDTMPGAIKLFADAAGVGTAEFLKMMEAGKVSSTILTDVADVINREWGGAIEKGSKTIRANMNRVSDALYAVRVEVGKGLDEFTGLNNKLGALAEWLQRVASNFSRLDKEAKAIILSVGIFLTALAPVLLILGGLIRLVAIAITLFRGIWGAVLLLGSAFRLLIVPMRAFMLLMAANPLVAFLTATALIITYWKEIVQLFKDAWGWIAKITGSKEDIANRQKNIDYSPTDFKPLLSSIGSGIVGGVDSFNNFLAQRSLLPESFKTGGAFNNPTNNTNKTNNLTFNFSAGTSASDAKSIEEAVKNALGEANKNAYMELGI